jgi:Na+-translocating ferredoxin:NAD+ oxidoreductase RnfE subunit
LIVASAGVSTTLITTSAVSVGSHKIAFAYKAGQFAIYIDGVQAGTSTATNFPVGTLSQIILANASYGTLNDSVKQAALFTRRLTNAELAAITTL